ncbi:MAG TPA: class I SAM-dependent methyltransferase [Firmicutes bacterium]|nr:class I SAM-dependent methyltransferase [Bacillota bacterium]
MEALERKWTFNTAAEEFDRQRPAYLPALYRDLFAYQPVGPSSSALEIGIGTGQATLPVLQTGCRVTAVELGDKLAAIARRKFRGFPDFTVYTGAFEDYPGKAGAFDLAYSAAAFHWIPEEVGYPKVWKLLRPGGAFARLAFHSEYRLPGQEALFDDIQAVYAVYMPGSKPLPRYTEEDAAARSAIAEKYGFVDTAFRLHETEKTLTAEEYAAKLAVQSDKLALDADTRRKFLAGIRAAVERRGGRITLQILWELNLARKP